MTLLHSLFDAAAPPRRRLARAALLLLLVAACAYRVWIVFRFNPLDNVWSDPQRHWEQGIDTLRSEPMSLVDPILYQLYIGALGKLTLQVRVLVAYWTSLLSLVGPWLWYRYLRELVRDRDLALAGWVVLAALPSWSALYSYFMQETLMLPLLGAALWATWRARRKGDVPAFVLATTAWILAGLTRGICLPLGAVALAWTWMAQPRKVPRALASAAVAAGILVPLAVRSVEFTGMIAPHGIGTMVQLYHRSGAHEITIEFRHRGRSYHWWFISPALLRPPFEPFSSWTSRRSGTAHFIVDMDQGSRGWDAAKASLPPWTLRRAAWLTGENLILLFFGDSWPDTTARERGIAVADHWERWLWAPLALGALALTVARRRREEERLLPALLLTWFLVQGVFPLAVNEGRYRKPFEGLLVAQCTLLAAGVRRERAGLARARASLSTEPQPPPEVMIERERIA